MHQLRRARLRVLHFLIGVLFTATLSTTANAQNSPQTPQGWNASVYSGSGTITPSPSYAVVDAAQYSGSDLCVQINNVFATYNASTSNGIVVDARGVPSSALNCTSGTNPWSNAISHGTSFWNIVLLPAGTITIQAPWVLPLWTHLIGQGPNSTVIAAASGLGSQDVIDMGLESNSMPCYVATGDCPGIVIEHLGLIGNDLGKGIVNCCAQELSRVNDVSMSHVTTGLALSNRFAQNSGPYSNLTISAKNACLAIGPATTGDQFGYMTMINSRGVHGLTCSVNTSNTAAIKIDGPGNSLEDISISTSSTEVDGILIGAQGPAQGNTLFNVQGIGLKNVIHVSPQTGSLQHNNAGNCPYPVVNSQKTVYNVCDLTIFGVARINGTSTVQDDLTNTTLKDTTLAMYVLGEIVGTNTTNIGYSRITTGTAVANTNATPWLVGATAPSGSCSVGAMYSCTGSSCPGQSMNVWEARHLGRRSSSQKTLATKRERMSSSSTLASKLERLI